MYVNQMVIDLTVSNWPNKYKFVSLSPVLNKCIYNCIAYVWNICCLKKIIVTQYFNSHVVERY